MVICDVFARYFFAAFSCFFSWLFHGPHFGKLLGVLGLENQGFPKGCFVRGGGGNLNNWGRATPIKLRCPPLTKPPFGNPQEKSSGSCTNIRKRESFPCVSEQCPADGVWRLWWGECLQTRFARHGLTPQRAPKQCPLNGV